MKIRIEGCTAEELAEYSPYLSLGKVYGVEEHDGQFVTFKGDHGREVAEWLPSANHLPEGAKWVEVTE